MLAEDNFGAGIMDKLISEIRDSFEKLRNCDGMLFDCPIEENAKYDARKLHEVCINHRLAIYFEQKIIPLLPKDEEYFVDIEFNREGLDFKNVKIAGQKKRVRPDIIIHNRKSDNDEKKNFLVVECKKSDTDEAKIDYDQKKIRALMDGKKYQYSFGIQVIYGKDQIKGTLFYRNRQGIEAEEIVYR